jgi:pimeloyl-ACP methyl ester carboxylesterase
LSADGLSTRDPSRTRSRVRSTGAGELQPFGSMRLLLSLALAAGTLAPVVQGQESHVVRVLSRDGTPIAVECAGSGPTLVIAHGGIGDRTRWTPMFPFLSSHFTVCAMDRRGHGASGDSGDYSLRKEAEDIAAVVDSRSGTVYLLGHSYGALGALEATFLTKRISKLLLYEPPLQDGGDLEIANRIEGLIQEGKREQAVTTFLREVVMVPPAELDAMRSRPGWRRLVDEIDSHPRQMRALAAYRFDAQRMRKLTIPTLLIRGSETRIPDVNRALRSLKATLPHWQEAVLQGQQHNAMDNGRELLADAITKFLAAQTSTEEKH